MTQFQTRLANMADVDALVGLARDSAGEAKMAVPFDAAHARTHFEELLRRGICILVTEQEEVIGTAVFTPIDVGFAMLKDYESAHIFIHGKHRSIHAVRALFDAIRDFADSRRCTMLLHQVSYAAALAGRKRDTERVESLYRYFELEGSFGITYVYRPKPKKDGEQ